MPVSARTATKLREAMARLLAGEPLHTDGALTKVNLAREAQVSHASEVQRDETIADLRKQLREAKAQVTEIQGKLDALATSPRTSTRRT